MCVCVCACGCVGVGVSVGTCETVRHVRTSLRVHKSNAHMSMHLLKARQTGAHKFVYTYARTHTKI